MAKRIAWLACMLTAWAGAALAQSIAPNGLSGPDESPACAAVGGIGSNSDCRRNGVQVNTGSGLAMSPDDQCVSVGGWSEGFACFRGNQQIDPKTGAPLQRGELGYEPQLENQPPLSPGTGLGQD
ncbi:hypothetical protein [Acidocella sp.]|uniref:hypothetical protein n=1 Tax=Acidocella sp. TaxID=50710 RepID=UPI003D027CE6